MSLLFEKAYINGEWVSASNQATFEVKNPANGETIGKVPNMAVIDAEKAIRAASDAFKTWQMTTAYERSQILKKWFALLNANSEAIAKLITAEVGKPLNEAQFEVQYGNSFVEWYAEEARRIRGEIIPSPVASKKLFVEKQPIGVVGLITPWNFPFAMVTRKAAAALAAGCTCVIKPAEDTPLVALAAVHLAEEAGVPKGVINVVTCDRPNAPAIGKTLCEHPSVAGISFTGSTQVGKLLYQQCALFVKRIALELGGNSPFIVFNSANIDKAIEGAIISKFMNCGQCCIGTNKFLIQEEVYDEFIKKFAAAVKNVKPGVTIGPLINISQFKKVSSIVEDAKSKGATILTGGKPASKLGELFYEPTIIVDVKKDMRLYKEEVFGPVATIIKFKTEEEALAMANDTEKGLGACFYTEDVSQMFRVGKLLESGNVIINDAMNFPVEAPFGGIKESGIGREGSHDGIDDFIYVKFLSVGGL